MASFQAISSSINPDSRTAYPDLSLTGWHALFRSCQRHFLDIAQHSANVQALAALMNIRLPCQRHANPATSSAQGQSVSLIPYIRRLIATGQDSPEVLRGFFGSDWAKGIGVMHQVERRNYLFAAKSTSWTMVKQAYDITPDETCPFLIPLSGATEEEIQSAESAWSEWLAMQDWMLGPRSPDAMKLSPQAK
jgi:hypothetical protein